MSAVLSVRIRRELKEEAERLGIDVRAVVERALEEEIKRVRMARLRELIDRALESMSTSVDDWIQSVKESREER
ncbi:MAG: DUF4145 domain-containing protein [Crenarchaeota archaeon]|nr:DUF4145 domain-containing protein [Thermoproteota archaeon]